MHVLKERPRPKDLTAHFRHEFSLDRIGSDLRLHYLKMQEEKQQRQLSHQEKVEAFRVVDAISDWLGSIYSQAFVAGQEHFQVKPYTLPGLTFERMRDWGRFETRPQLIGVQLPKILEFMEKFHSLRNYGDQLEARVEVERVVYEEVAHFYQSHIPRNYELFAEYGQGWEHLSEEEKKRVYYSHPLEKEAKIFAAEAVLEKIREEVRLLEGKKLEKDLKMKAYLESKIQNLLADITWISSLSYPGSARPAQSSNP